MRFSTLFVIASTFATALAGPAGVETSKLPIVSYHSVKIDGGRTSAVAGSPNGLYVYHNETHAAYYGAESPSPVVSRSLSSRSAALSCDVSCNGQQASESDISAAEAGLEGWFGSGLCWTKQIYYLYDSVYAFGCDYGNGQCQTSDQYKEEIECVDNSCGTRQGGWNSVHSAKVTYGREVGSFGC